MKINTNETVVEVDCDGTLILHDYWDYPTLPRVIINYYGVQKTVAIHTEHVDLLKSYKKRGFYIQVQSHNGFKHAKEVVTKLGLEDFVDEVRTKTSKNVDDIEKDTRQYVYIPMKKG